MSSSKWQNRRATRRLWRRGVMKAGVGAAALAAVCAGTASLARAESLREALAAAYTYSPKLDAERARLRATDENVTRAESGWRPSVSGSADFGAQDLRTKPDSSSSGTVKPWGYSVSVRQHVFDGFRTSSEISEAEANVRAGRETLRLVETNTLLDAVSAYMDVLSAQAIVRIRENNVDVLNEELHAAKTRRAVKEVTRTDVAQAQARLARAVSTADLAKSDLKTARAIYERVIGHAPGKLSLPPISLREVPASIEDAWRSAEQQNPQVGGALHREEAARYAVDKIRGELLPEVNLEASYGVQEDPNGFFDEQETASVKGRVSIPLYDGGETRARVRQAKQIHVARLQEIEQARSETQAAVTAAWSALMGQKAKLKSDQVQVEANRIALEGVREEQKVGQRTLLDVLNAEQEYLDSQIELVSSRSAVVVAGYRLLAAMGQLSAEQLGLTAMVYDPAVHLEEARQNWFGIDITHANGRRETYEAIDDPDFAAESADPASEYQPSGPPILK